MSHSKEYGFGASDQFSRLFEPIGGGGGGGGGSLWAPDQLSDLSAWFDASDASTVDLLQGDVQEWKDKAKPEYQTKFVASNNLVRPTYADTINGLSVIRMNEASCKMYSSTKSADHKWTQDDGEETSVVIVYKSLAIESKTVRLLLGNDENLWFMGPYSANHQLYTGNFQQGPGVNDPTTVIAIAQSTTGNQVTFSVNGTTVSTISKVKHEGNRFNLGYSNTDCYSDVAEIICWASGTLGDRELIEGYLSHKWNIPLPSGHTYFAAAPTI